MEYVVIKAFTDKNDGQHYAVGERYPRRGFATKERLEELSTDKNKRGVVLIAAKSEEAKKKEEKVEEPEKVTKPKTTKKKSTKE